MAVTRLVLQRSFRARRRPFRGGLGLLAGATGSGPGAALPALPQRGTPTEDGRPGGAAGASMRLVRPALRLGVAGGGGPAVPVPWRAPAAVGEGRRQQACRSSAVACRAGLHRDVRAPARLRAAADLRAGR